MRIYTVYEPAFRAPRLDDPASVIFLKEGFCWPALFVPLPWFLYHRMWWAAGVYVAASVLLGMAGQLLGPQEFPAALLGLGFGLIVAFEAHELRRWQLTRRGFRHAASVAAKNLLQAEARYFAGRNPVAPVAAAPSAAAPAQPILPGAAQPGWGFLPPDQRLPLR